MKSIVSGIGTENDRRDQALIDGSDVENRWMQSVHDGMALEKY